MTHIDTDIIGFDIELLTDGVILNDKVLLKKPRACSVTDWESLWKRMDKSFGSNARLTEDGLEIVDLDKE